MAYLLIKRLILQNRYTSVLSHYSTLSSYQFQKKQYLKVPYSSYFLDFANLSIQYPKSSKNLFNKFQETHYTLLGAKLGQASPRP